MFMQRQLRTDYASNFFTPDLDDQVAAIRAMPGAQAVPLTPRDPKIVGPIGLNLLLPLSDDSLDAAQTMCRNTASLYVSWMKSAERAGQTASQMAFAQDCKVRAAMLRYNTEVCGLSPAETRYQQTIDQTKNQTNVISDSFLCLELMQRCRSVLISHLVSKVTTVLLAIHRLVERT
jgi:hypothetical protein